MENYKIISLEKRGEIISIANSIKTAGSSCDEPITEINKYSHKPSATRVILKDVLKDIEEITEVNVDITKLFQDYEEFNFFMLSICDGRSLYEDLINLYIDKPKPLGFINESDYEYWSRLEDKFTYVLSLVKPTQNEFSRKDDIFEKYTSLAKCAMDCLEFIINTIHDARLEYLKKVEK